MATKEIDKTFLSLDLAEERGFIHRDYIAHCFRWSHVIKFLQQKHRYQSSKILDLGCGKEVPLLKTMYTSKMTPLKYTGADYGPINISDCVNKAIDKCGDAALYEGYDVSEDTAQLIPKDYNIITSFEVFEHMTPRKLLKLIGKLNMSDADMFISTPNFNGSAAANHHNEMTQDFLTELFEANGLKVVEKFGTFASQKDYMGKLREDGYENLFNRLSEYYDSNVLAIVFAPIYPELSRNVMYHLKAVHEPSKERTSQVIAKYAHKQQDVEGWEGLI